MERLAFTFDIYAGQEDEYKRRHDAIWPEMSAAVREAGMRNYSLFRRGQQVVGYCECEPDVATALGRIGATDVNRRWATWFEEVIVTLTDESGELKRLDEVWHQD